MDPMNPMNHTSPNINPASHKKQQGGRAERELRIHMLDDSLQIAIRSHTAANELTVRYIEGGIGYLEFIEELAALGWKRAQGR